MSSRIEDFATELWFEVFSYLNIRHQFDAFFNLNKRLNQIQSSSCIRISLKDNEDTEYLFQHISPHREGVIGLRLENTNKMQLIDHANLLYFPHLITFILHRLHIKEDFLKLYQQNITHLRYLSISPLVSVDKKIMHQLLEMILSIPNLQTCRLRLGIGTSPIQPTLVTKSPIKYLHLNGVKENCFTNRFIILLQYLPCLQSLSITANRLSFIPIVNVKNIFCAPSVAVFTLNINEFVGSFVEFTNFIVTLTPHVQELTIVCRTAVHNLTYVNHVEWILFINSLPKLKKLLLNIRRPGEIDEELWNKSCQILTKRLTKTHLVFRIDK